MKIYLDTSALNRIFDDQSQIRIHWESTAMELIFLLIENEAVEIVSSDAPVFETDNNPYNERKIFIESVLQKARFFQVFNTNVLDRAQQLEFDYSIKGLDALHLACAESLQVDCFITCDDRLTKKYQGSLDVKNPTVFTMNIIQSLEQMRKENQNDEY